jgi:predicted MFS family arabinose efflux permease
MGTTLDDPAPYRLTLWIAPLTYVLATLLFAAMRPVAATSKEDSPIHYTRAPIALFIYFTVICFLSAIGEGAARSFFNLYLDSELHVSTGQIGAAMGFAQLLPVIIALLTPLLLTRLGTSMTLAAASAVCALCLALMGFVPQWLVATVALMGIQGAIAVMGPTRNLFSQEIVAPRWRTTTAALATIGLALAWATTAAFGGYAITVMGYRAFFLLCSGLVMGSACLLLPYWWRTKVALRSSPEAARLAGD